SCDCLSATNGSTNSTNTTCTNLSFLDEQSSCVKNNVLAKGSMFKENLIITIPEIEPLHKNQDMDITNSQQEFDSSAKDTQTIEWKNKTPQIIAALAVSWASMVVGFTMGYTSPADTSLKRDMNITNLQFSWISGIMPLSALVGSLLGGPLIEYFGRKGNLVFSTGLFLIGWFINYCAEEYWHMFVSRVITGCGVGIVTLTLPVYVGETIQPEIRGTLGLFPSAFGNIGILICFLMGVFFEWREIAIIGVLLSLILVVLLSIIPETPYWYVSKGKLGESRKSLQHLRGKNNPDATDKEYEELLTTHKISDEKINNVFKLFEKTNLKSVMIVLGLMFFQQMSGINVIIFYTTQIFNDTGSNINASIQTVIIGIVNFISTIIATILIDKLGRKPLLYISSATMIVTLGVLGTYFYLLKVVDVNTSVYGCIPLMSVIIYVLGFSFGFGPVPWLMMGEIFPTKIRGSAASVSTSFNWMCTSTVTTTFPLFRDIIGFYGVFLLFCVMTILSLIFTIFCVPETKGESLEDIERKLAASTMRS
ncbi:Sugar tr and/or MFS 1 domain containing protein, partial [Asbolus verrucosus]